MEKVLITDCAKRKSLPVVRSLGKKGIRVTGGESSQFSLSFFLNIVKRE